MSKETKGALSLPPLNIDLVMPTPETVARGAELPVTLVEGSAPVVLHVRSFSDFTVLRGWMQAMDPKNRGLAMNHAEKVCDVLLVKVTGLATAEGEPIQVEMNEENKERLCVFLMQYPPAMTAITEYIQNNMLRGSVTSEAEEAVGKSSSGSESSTNSATSTSEP